MTSAAEDFAVVPPFEIRSGAEQRVPFVFNSPHSGRHYPDRFLAMAPEGMGAAVVCFASLMPRQVPTEAHDRPIPLVITEEGTFGAGSLEK